MPKASLPGLNPLGVVAAAATLLMIVAGCNDGGDGNRPPQIVSGISLPSGTVHVGEKVSVRVVSVTDADGDPVTYLWSAERGTFEQEGPLADPVSTYVAPSTAGSDRLTVVVNDGTGGTATDTFELVVVSGPTGTPSPDATSTPAVSPTAAPSIAISEPLDEAIVEHTTQVVGTYSDVPSGVSIWLIVQPHLAPTFHPQNAPAIASDGEWSAIVYFGESPSRNIGEQFELIAVSANEEGSRAFAAYLDEAAEDGSFPGLAFLPEGTEVQDQITVTRE